MRGRTVSAAVGNSVNDREWKMVCVLFAKLPGKIGNGGDGPGWICDMPWDYFDHIANNISQFYGKSTEKLWIIKNAI